MTQRPITEKEDVAGGGKLGLSRAVHFPTLGGALIVVGDLVVLESLEEIYRAVVLGQDLNIEMPLVLVTVCGSIAGFLVVRGYKQQADSVSRDIFLTMLLQAHGSVTLVETVISGLGIGFLSDTTLSFAVAGRWFILVVVYAVLFGIFVARRLVRQ